MRIDSPQSDGLLGQQLILFILVSLIILVAYGVDVDRFLTYNLFYSDIVFQPSKYDDFPLSLVAENRPISLFHQFLGAIVLTPAINLIAAVTLSVMAMWVGFFALKTQATSTNVGLVIIIVALVAHGFVPGFDSSSLVFDRKAVIAFLLIGGIYSLAKDYIALFLVLSCFGVLIHPLDMLSGLAFLLPGYGLYALIRSRRHFSRFILLAACLVGFVLLVRPETHAGATPLEYSVFDWYRFALMLEVGDVALYDLLWKTMGINGLLILLSTLIAIQNRRNLRFIDCLALTFGPLATMLVSFELIQATGLTFGLASEFFISLQFRRGLWVVSIVALTQILLFFLEQSEEHGKTGRIVFSLVLCAALLHSLVVIGLVAMVLIVFRARTLGLRGWLMLGFGVLLLVFQFVIQIDDLRLMAELQKVLLLIALTVTGCFIMKKSIRRGALAIILIYSGIILGNNNFRHEVFNDSWSQLSQNDKELTEQIFATVSYNASEELRRQLDILKSLNELTLTSSGAVLFASPVLGYAGPIVSDRQFIFSRWDNTLMFDRNFAARYVNKLEDFGVDWKTCWEQESGGTACLLNRIQSRIEKLSEEELLNLARSYDFRYVIRKTPLGGKQIYGGSGLKIYDLANFEEKQI